MSNSQNPKLSNTLSQARIPPEKCEIRESQDNYCRVVASNQEHRVIVCCDEIQFIIQRSVGRHTSITGREWRGFSYHRQRASLIRRVEEICRGPVGELFGGTGIRIAALPERCDGYDHVSKSGGLSP